MHYLGIGLCFVVWTLACLWAGMKYGAKDIAALRSELDQARARLGAKVAGNANPYAPVSVGGQKNRA